MDSRNLLILFIYLVCVSYVIYRAINSLDREKVTIDPDQDSLNEQLEAKNLKDWLDVQFIFAKRHKLEEMRQLLIQIKNKSQDTLIDIDWDHCSLSGIGKESQRVLRLPPSTNLAQPQIVSVVSPGKTIEQTLSTESVIRSDSSEYLFNLAKVKSSSPKVYTDFMTRKSPLRFSFSLALRVLEPSIRGDNYQTHVIDCVFFVNKVPWTDSLRWLPKSKPKKK